MKITLKIICLLLFMFNISCKAQTVPLNTYDYSNGAYLKDLDNILPFWVGTWKGVVNNKEYTFEFTIFNHQYISYLNDDYHYEDMLMCKFKVVDLTTNQILYNDLNDLNNSSFENYKIKYLANISSDFFFTFYDSEVNCYNIINFTLSKFNNNPNQILYKDFSYGENLNFDCPYANQEDIPMFLPKVDLVLTRQ